MVAAAARLAWVHLRYASRMVRASSGIDARRRLMSAAYSGRRVTHDGMGRLTRHGRVFDVNVVRTVRWSDAGPAGPGRNTVCIGATLQVALVEASVVGGRLV